MTSFGRLLYTSVLLPFLATSTLYFLKIRGLPANQKSRKTPAKVPPSKLLVNKVPQNSRKSSAKLPLSLWRLAGNGWGIQMNEAEISYHGWRTLSLFVCEQLVFLWQLFKKYDYWSNYFCWIRLVEEYPNQDKLDKISVLLWELNPGLPDGRPRC